MPPSPERSPLEDDEWEDVPEPASPPSTERSPYRAMGVRDEDAVPKRRKRKASRFTAIASVVGGLGILGVVFVLTRVPVRRPSDTIVAPPAPEPIAPMTNDLAGQVVPAGPVPAALVEGQRTEMTVALAFDRADYGAVEREVLPRLSSASCVQLEMLYESCRKLGHWDCALPARDELFADGCVKPPSPSPPRPIHPIGSHTK